MDRTGDYGARSKLHRLMDEILDAALMLCIVFLLGAGSAGVLIAIIARANG